MHQRLLLSLAAVACVGSSFGQAVSPSQNVPTSNAPTLNSITVFPDLTDLVNTTNVNYVREYTPQTATTNSGDIEIGQFGAPYIETTVTTGYLDGLGRPLQDIVRGGAQIGRDLAVVHAYDDNGRESHRYLPVSIVQSAADLGRLTTVPLQTVDGFCNTYRYGEHPYSETQYDNSPLQRVVKQLPEGNTWVGNARGTTIDYTTNYSTSAEPTVLKWTVGTGASDLPDASGGSYSYNQLLVERYTDEDGKVSSVIKDKQGRQICSRQFDGSTVFSTYYVYDDLQHLRYVITPKALINGSSGFSGSTTSTTYQDILKGLCYQYVYDEKGRVVEKKLPGKEIEYFIYDKYDRLVLTQDGMLRTGGGGVTGGTGSPYRWKYYSYDVLGRPTSYGIYTTTLTRPQLVAAVVDATVPATTTLLHYLNQAHLYDNYGMSSAADAEVLTYNYFDDYLRAPTGTAFSTASYSYLAGPPPYAILPVDCYHTRGLLTGTKVKIMDGATTPNWINTTRYYDNMGRLIQDQSNNLHVNGKNTTTYQYDFSGTLISTALHHVNPDAYSPDQANSTTQAMHRVTDLVKKYTKDYTNGRIKKLEQGINAAGLRQVYFNTYDPLGRVQNKQQGAIADNLYTYNIRSWLTGINASTLDLAPPSTFHTDFFHEQITYDHGFASRLYDGNIAGIRWRGNGNFKRFYGYTYDNLSRLNHAEFGEANPATSSTYSKSTHDLTASNITYDENGNILTMDQRGPGAGGPIDMDLMTYDYPSHSNQLSYVTESSSAVAYAPNPDFRDGNSSGADYAYDANGNLEKDYNKGISTAIDYSYHNKPLHIDLNGTGTIDYLYDANGVRLKKTVNDQTANTTTVTEYDGPFVYEYINPSVSQDVSLKHIVHEEGRCRPNPNAVNGVATFMYDVFVKDHLNNVRSVLKSTPSSLSDVFQYEATLEVAAAIGEGLVWSHLDDVRSQNPASTVTTDVHAAELIGTSETQRVGTAVMLRVMPGDRFTITAESYYDALNNSNANTASELAGSLFAALSGGTSNNLPVSESPLNMGVITNTVGNPGFADAYDDLLTANTSTSSPASYLNYLLFDDQFNLVSNRSGVFQAGSTANQWNGIGTYQAEDIDRSGYLLIFTASKEEAPIYWNNVDLTFYKGEVLEENHYYPFGLTLTDQYSTALENNYLLTTKELQSDFKKLYWYDFGARMQDEQLGRWNGIDPLSQKYPHESPYAYVGNSPVKAIDIGGKFKFNCTSAQMRELGLSSASVGTFQTIVSNVGNIVNSNAMSAMSNTTGFSVDRIRQDLQAGNGPEIKLSTNGSDASGGGMNISSKSIAYLASLDPNSQEYQNQVLGLALEILHEYGHYGDQATNGGYNTGQFQVIRGTDDLGRSAGTQIKNYTDLFPPDKVKARGSQNYHISPTGHRGKDVEVMGYGVETVLDSETGQIKITPQSSYPDNIWGMPAPPSQLPTEVQGRNVLETLDIE